MAITEIDRTNGQGSFFDQEKNYGYINGTLFRDKNEYLKRGGTVPNSGGGGGGAAMGAFQQPTIDLKGIYDKLYKDSGIQQTQEQFDVLGGQITEKQKARDAVLAGINDNPFYSEGTRVGRAAKVNEKYNADAQTLTQQQQLLQNKIATSKADVETRLGLETKQFDINNQQAQQAISQFNTLLAAGALDGASGEDIAQITRATGMSSSIISSAIQANKDKNVQTAMVSYDDGDNQGFAIVDSRTGNIINKQTIAPSATKTAAASGSGGGAKAPTAAQKKTYLATAKTGVKNVDTNKDKLLSLQEFEKVIQNLINLYGLDGGTATQIAAEAMSGLGYKKWKW